jgi:hypothetical protein
MQRLIKIIVIVLGCIPNMQLGCSFALGANGVGGLDAQPPPWTEFSNLLENPGFEMEGGSWKIGTGCSVNNEESHLGFSSIKCEGDFGNTRQEKILGTNCFKVKGWIKASSDATGTVRLAVYNNSRGGTKVHSISARVGENLPQNEWTQITMQSPKYLLKDLSNDIFEFRIESYGVTSGTFYFDDLEFIPLFPLIRTFVTYPNYRGFIWSDKDQRIKGVVETNAPSGGNLLDYKVQLSFKNAEGGVDLGQITLNNLTGEDFFEFDVANYPNNTEILMETVMIAKGSSQYIAEFPGWRIVKKHSNERSLMDVWFDEDNWLHFSGKKRFLWGAYFKPDSNISSTYLRTNAYDYANTFMGFEGKRLVENIQDTKCNAMLYWSPMSGANPNQINAWCDTLYPVGSAHLHIVHEFHEGKDYRPGWAGGLTDEELWFEIGTTLNSEGFLGYYTADEPDFRERMTAGQGWNIYQALREHNKDNPCFAVMYNPGHIYSWRCLIDVMGTDPYPLGRGVTPGDYLYGDISAPFFGQVTQWSNELIKASFGSRPVWLVTQLFEGTRGDAYPSYSDLKKIAWKAIIAGAHGILWWAWEGSTANKGLIYQYFDASPPNQQAWLDFKRISSEVMGLESVITTKSIANLISCNNNYIDYRVKQGNGKLYVFASNKTETPQQNVSFQLISGNMNGNVEVYSEGRVINAAGQHWTDAFDAYGVHVYEIEKGNEIPDAPKNLRFF